MVKVAQETRVPIGIGEVVDEIAGARIDLLKERQQLTRRVTREPGKVFSFQFSVFSILFLLNTENRKPKTQLLPELGKELLSSRQLFQILEDRQQILAVRMLWVLSKVELMLISSSGEPVFCFVF